ncbi:hypothetical protein QOZ80_5AG0385330 [Eleusine coracana subsp. coracana]|nr:hypothetical protein QOZ80_5AG0385330 [Eleusine coracana subsp. coracana]
MEPALPVPKPGSLAALTDHLLEDILVRIDTRADLARASAACKAFRRLVTDPAFLRRYRALHPPLILGFINFLSAGGFVPTESPHRNAPAARAFAAAADFSIDHMPRRHYGWRLCDARDGRILLLPIGCVPRLASPELAVFDPLTRGYTLLPPIPEGQLASILTHVPDKRWEYFDALFDPSVANEEAQFRVICWRQCPVMAAVFVYSSVSGRWTHGSISWATLGLNVRPENVPFMRLHSYAYGYSYWNTAGSNNKMLKVDINSIELTTVSLPPDHENRKTIFVEAGEGRIGMFSIIDRNPQPLRYSVWQNESENANEHPVETTILLPHEYDWYTFEGAAHGYVFLVGRRENSFHDLMQEGHSLNPTFFSLEIKTMKVERLCLSKSDCGRTTPFMSSRML